MLDYVENLLSAETLQDVWSLHAGRMDAYGFDRMIYGRSFDIASNTFGKPQDMLFLSTMPDAFDVRFRDEGLYAHAPMNAWTNQKSDVQVWSWDGYRAAGSSQKARDAVALNRRFRVRAGYTVSFGATPPCGRASIALIARSDLDRNAIGLVWELHGRTITLMNRLAHLRFSGMPHDGEVRKLTARQREVLQLVGNGLTTAEIAKAMGLSPVTIEKHLKLARQQLDAGTSAQAVLRAALQHHIYLERD